MQEQHEVAKVHAIRVFDVGSVWLWDCQNKKLTACATMTINFSKSCCSRPLTPRQPPVGIECPGDSCGIFPITAEDTPVVAKSRTFDFQFTFSHQNFGSFYENEDLAQADFDRCIVAGFVDEFHALDDKIFGPAKIACLLKVKPDFTVKVRLIVELRSGVNGRVTLRERVVFP